MAKPPGQLANLASIGKLVVEPGAQSEIEGLLASGTERLADARNHVPLRDLAPRVAVRTGLRRLAAARHIKKR